MKNKLLKRTMCAAMGGTKRTEISFLHFDGTATRNGAIKWLEDAAQRFAKEKENEEYESGKKGVKVRVSTSKLIPYATLGSDGNDIYLDEARADMYRYSASNNLLQLDEVIDHIKRADYRPRRRKKFTRRRKFRRRPSLLRTSSIRVV